MTSTTRHTEPLSFDGEPLTVQTEPGRFPDGVPYQRFRLGDMWITVGADGRLRLGSYARTMTVTALLSSAGGTGLDIATAPIGGELTPKFSDLEPVVTAPRRGDAGDAL